MSGKPHQRAIGWCEMVPELRQLALEQPIEHGFSLVGLDGFPAVIRGTAFTESVDAEKWASFGVNENGTTEVMLSFLV